MTTEQISLAERRAEEAELKVRVLMETFHARAAA